MGTLTAPQVVLRDKLKHNFDDYGWRVALTKSIAYLLRPIYAHQVFRIHRIDLEKALSEEIAGAEFTFSLITAQDVDRIAQVEAMAEWLRGTLRDRLVAGQRCLVALAGSDVVAFNLVRFDQISLPLARLAKRLPPGAAWSEDILVRRDFRRKGVAARLRLRLLHDLRQRGIRRFYAGTHRSNLASARMQESVGLKMIAEIHYRRVLMFQNWWCKRLRANQPKLITRNITSLNGGDAAHN